MRLLALAVICFFGFLSTAATAAVADIRGQDAADAFAQLCVPMFVGGKPGADPDRFDVTKLSDETRKQIKPHVKADTLWDVYATASNTSMLVHYEPQGLCVVEVAEADEASVQRAVAQVAADSAALVDPVYPLDPR